MSSALWLWATIGVSLCAILSVVGSATTKSWLSLPSLLPAGVGLFLRAGDRHHFATPGHGWIVALSVAMIVLAIVSGAPLTTWVLELTDRASPTSTPNASSPELLRGGATIGYLERIAVVGAVALGHLDVVAAVIAVKGLGRFSELSSPAARERFIIGTLVSLLWSGLVAGLIWPPR